MRAPGSEPEAHLHPAARRVTAESVMCAGRYPTKGRETRQDSDLLFCTRNGKALAAGNVRRAFRSITKAAGIGEDWTPRELRHAFVSIMSDNDVPIEKIADFGRAQDSDRHQDSPPAPAHA